MTQPALIERITRSLAYMLRHQPEQFDLELDEYGFAELEDVVQALNERLGESVEDDDVRDAVTAGDRVRYEIANGRIRALYGHSIEVKPGEPSKPPALLYVGVSRADAERAQRYGLRAGRRRFLHLALTPEDALETGRRSARDYVVITVNALEAWEDGINFYDRKSLFLSDPIPTHFLELGDVHSDGYGDESERRFGAAPRRDDERGRERHERFPQPRERGERTPDARESDERNMEPPPSESSEESRPFEPESRPAQEERAPEHAHSGGEHSRGGRRRRRRGGRRHEGSSHGFGGEAREAEHGARAAHTGDEPQRGGAHGGAVHAGEERHAEPRGGGEWRGSGQRAHGDERREAPHRHAGDVRQEGERHGEGRQFEPRRGAPRHEGHERRAPAHAHRAPPARHEERHSGDRGTAQPHAIPTGAAERTSEDRAGSFGSGVFEESAPRLQRERAPAPPPPRERRPEPTEKKREVADDTGFGAGI